MSWEEVLLVEKLKAVIDYRGKTPKKAKTGVITLSAKSVKMGYIDYSKAYHISKETYNNFMVRGFPKKGDILMTTEAPLGCIAKLDREDVSVAQRLLILRTKNFELNNDYLKYFLMSPRGQNELKSRATGTTVQGIKKAEFKKVKILCPPLTTQKRIADILSAYDDLIENNLKRIKLLEQAAQNIYKEWFVHLRFPGHEEATFDAETGLPEGWEEKTAFDLFEIKGGSQPPKSQWSTELKEGYVRMIQIRDYKTDSHIAYVRNTKKLRKCNNEDIMIARYGASVGRICWGISGAYNVALAKVIPYDKDYSEFIRWYVKSYFFQESLLSMTKRAAQDGFNKNTFKSIVAVIPTLEVVLNFKNVVYPFFKQMELLQKENQKLKEAREILLPRLMNRTIEV